MGYNEKKAGRFGHTGNMPVCCFIPPHSLESMAENAGSAGRAAAQETLRKTAQLIGNREILSLMGTFDLNASGGRNRNTYDALTFTRLPGIIKRKEVDGPCGLEAADEAHDGSGIVYEFLQTVFGRDSLDGRGMRLVSTVNYGNSYLNAFWQGRQMVYGQGDGETFNRFTSSLSVIAHELCHGLIQFTCPLRYQGQSGALNESFADVFGVCVEQKARGIAAVNDPKAWVVGRGLFTPSVMGQGVRNMLEPGTAYDDEYLGRDPQPKDMDGYINTVQDNGGVHLNSGLPNRAFALTACQITGGAWEKPAAIWARCLTKHLTPDSGFSDCAAGTIRAAQDLYGLGSSEERAVRNAWIAVKVPFQVN